MANIFSRKLSRDIGTTLTAVGSYTVGVDTQTTVIGLSLCNTTASPILVDATVNDAVNDYYLLKGAPIPVGGSIAVIGGDEKVVITTNDSIKVKSSAVSSLDAVMSILEIT